MRYPMSACPRCPGGECKQCKQLARVFRQAVRRAREQPGFLALLKAVGDEVIGDGKVVAGGLPADASVERVLMQVSRAVQAERRAGE